MFLSSYNKKVGRIIYVTGTLTFGCISYLLADAPIVILLVILLIFIVFTLQMWLFSFVRIEARSFIIENIFKGTREFSFDEFEEIESFFGVLKITFKGGYVYRFLGQSLQEVKKRIGQEFLKEPNTNDS